MNFLCEFMFWNNFLTCQMVLMTEISNTSELLEACLRYLVLGIVQGLTEFLPISSTAHLKVVPMMLGWPDPGVSVTAVLQLGSIFSVLTYFRKDLKNILKGITLGLKFDQWREPNAKLGIAIFTGTIPILLLGISIKLFWADFEDSYLRSIPFIACISILMALLLGLAEKMGNQKKDLLRISGRDGFLIGLGQMLALIPGVSRSGITLTSSMFCGLKRADSARFAFLIGLPAITFAGLAEVKNSLSGIYEFKSELLPLIIGISAAAFVSWIVIDWLLQYLQKNSTWTFIAYRLLFGVTLLFWWWGIPST